jgi:hypothetical protein
MEYISIVIMGADELRRERTGDGNDFASSPEVVKDTAEERGSDSLAPEPGGNGGREKCDTVTRSAVNNSADGLAPHFGLVDPHVTVFGDDQISPISHAASYPFFLPVGGSARPAVM